MGADSARTASFSMTRDAVKEISSQTSQSAILRALVDYAEQFCPRGVFFIVRNEHFVGWQALGREASVDDATVRELSFSLSDATALGDSVRSGRCDVVRVARLSDVGRDMRELVKLLASLREHGIGLQAIGDGVDTFDPRSGSILTIAALLMNS